MVSARWEGCGFSRWRFVNGALDAGWVDGTEVPLFSYNTGLCEQSEDSETSKLGSHRLRLRLQRDGEGR